MIAWLCFYEGRILPASEIYDAPRLMTYSETVDAILTGKEIGKNILKS